MRATRDAIVDRLLAVNAIVSKLSTFRSVPAIFAGDPIPPSVVGRYISVREAVFDEPWESKLPENPPADYVGTRGRVVAHDVTVWEDQTGDSSELEDVAELIRDAFQRYPLTVSGYGTLIAKTHGPVTAADNEVVENQVDGRIITVELTVIKSPS